ncbi:MAG: lactate racemase domain-containing protein, partial [Candidatus Bathyarchaeia archaeon]
MVECWLPYGKTEVHVTVPIKNLLGIVEVEAEIAEEPEKEIIASIRGLTDLASKGKRVAVALEGELPSPYIGLIVERVVKEFLEANVNAEEISIIVSPGTFGSVRTDLREQLKPLEKLNIKITQHSWSQRDIISAGESEGTKILLNREFVEADIRVLIGEVKPDPIAGYSGGASILFPGLSEVRSIESSLRKSLDTGGRLSVLEGNPIYEDSREVARLVDVDFTVNIVSDPEGRPIRIFSGELEKSWKRAVELAEKTYTVPVEKGGDVFVVSAGGYPYDRTLCRASMAIEGISRLGGRESKIILLAECSEGVGD